MKRTSKPMVDKNTWNAEIAFSTALLVLFVFILACELELPITMAAFELVVMPAAFVVLMWSTRPKELRKQKSCCPRKRKPSNRTLAN